MTRTEIRQRKRAVRLNWRYYRRALKRSDRNLRNNYHALAGAHREAADLYEGLARKLERELSEALGQVTA